MYCCKMHEVNRFSLIIMDRVLLVKIKLPICDVNDIILVNEGGYSNGEKTNTGQGI